VWGVQLDVTLSWDVTDHAPGLLESTARARQYSVPTGSVVVLTWWPFGGLSSTSAGLNAAEVVEPNGTSERQGAVEQPTVRATAKASQVARTPIRG
jgi:hypothetical protein